MELSYICCLILGKLKVEFQLRERYKTWKVILMVISSYTKSRLQIPLFQSIKSVNEDWKSTIKMIYIFTIDIIKYWWAIPFKIKCYHLQVTLVWVIAIQWRKLCMTKIQHFELDLQVILWMIYCSLWGNMLGWMFWISWLWYQWRFINYLL